MKKKRTGKTPPKPAKPRNPIARALGGGLFRAKATRRRDAYLRQPRHRKPWESPEDG